MKFEVMCLRESPVNFTCAGKVKRRDEDFGLSPWAGDSKNIVSFKGCAFPSQDTGPNVLLYVS